MSLSPRWRWTMLSFEMSRPARFILLFAITLLLFGGAGCGTARLREGEAVQPGGGELLRELARRRGLEIWERSAELNITLVDRWDSTLLRWLTPLPANEQRLSLTLSPGGKRIRLEFLGGDRAGEIIGVDEGAYYEMDEGVPRYLNRPLARIYLESLALYVELIFRAPRMAEIALLGDADCSMGRCRRVYAGPGAAAPGGDEYIVWLSPAGDKAPRIDFTYRELGAAYQGRLQLDGEVESQGLRMPGRIDILSTDPDAAPAHTVLIESLTSR